jgi:hypothetical protein
MPGVSRRHRPATVAAGECGVKDQVSRWGPPFPVAPCDNSYRERP